MEEISGFSKKELILKQFFDFVHPDHKDFVRKRGQDRLKGKNVKRKYDLKILDKKNKTKWLNISASPINWYGSQSVVVSCIDITQRKNATLKLEENEMRYRTLFEFSPGGIVLIDEKGFILESNESFCVGLGYSRDEIEGKHITHVADTDNIAFVEKNLEKILNGENLRHEVYNKYSDGTFRIRELHETRVILPDGKYGVLSISSDITEKKKIEMELDKLSQVVIQSPISVIITDDNGNILIMQRVKSV